MKLSATLTPNEATRHRWDCAVIGAGPAGAMAGREMAMRGASVLLIEKAEFPRYKVCGCCLNPRSLEILGDTGLDHIIGDGNGIAVNRVRLAASGRIAEFGIPQGAAISRSEFDLRMAQEAIAKGVQFLPNTAAFLESKSPDYRTLKLRSGTEEVVIESRIVIAATGLAGQFEKGNAKEAVVIEPGSRIGAGVITELIAGYSRDVIHMACGRSGYVGIVQIEGDRLDIAAALDAEAVRRAGGIGPVAAEIMTQSGLPEIPELANRPWKGTPFLTRHVKHLAEERLFRIGDAAGYVEPFTGEGMAWALAAGRAVVPLAIAGVETWSSDLIAEWNRIYRYEVARRQTTCRLAAAVLRQPFLTGSAVRLLSAMPLLAKPILRGMYRR